MNKLRVLQVIPDLRKGGAERLTLDICIELLKMENLEVILLNFRQDNDYEYLTKKVKRKVIPACFVPSISGYPTRQLDDYADFLQEFQPHIIHSHLFEAEMTTRQVINPGIMYITHLHDNMKQFMNFSYKTLLVKSNISAYYEKRLMIHQYRKCGNRFIAVSKHTAEYFKKSLPADLRNIVTMHNAIDYKRFSVGVKSAVNNGIIKLITVGSLIPLKNHVFLVEVVKILNRVNISAQLLILGEGPEHQNIQKKINSLNLQDCVFIKGKVDNVEDYLCESDIYVHASITESFGLTMLEAMAAGLPFVVVDANGNREIAENGKNGFIIDTHDATLFAAYVEKLWNEDSLYQKMSEYARLFSKRFDIQGYGAWLVDYYNELRITNNRES